MKYSSAQGIGKNGTPLGPEITDHESLDLLEQSGVMLNTDTYIPADPNIEPYTMLVLLPSDPTDESGRYYDLYFRVRQ